MKRVRGSVSAYSRAKLLPKMGPVYFSGRSTFEGINIDQHRPNIDPCWLQFGPDGFLSQTQDVSEHQTHLSIATGWAEHQTQDVSVQRACSLLASNPLSRVRVSSVMFFRTDTIRLRAAFTLYSSLWDTCGGSSRCDACPAVARE